MLVPFISTAVTDTFIKTWNCSEIKGRHSREPCTFINKLHDTMIAESFIILILQILYHQNHGCTEMIKQKTAKIN